LGGAVLTGLVVVCLGACGSTGTEVSAPSTHSAKETILAFLDATIAGDTAIACSLITDDLASAIRTSALAHYKPEAASVAERNALRTRQAERTKECPAALKLRADELGDRLTRLRASVAADKARNPQEGGPLWILGGKHRWTVGGQGDHWQIYGAPI